MRQVWASGIVIDVEDDGFVRGHPGQEKPFMRRVGGNAQDLTEAIRVDQSNIHPVLGNHGGRANKAERRRLNLMLNRAPDIDKPIACLVKGARAIFADNIDQTLFSTRLIIVIMDVAGRAARGIRIINAHCVIEYDHLRGADLRCEELFQLRIIDMFPILAVREFPNLSRLIDKNDAVLIKSIGAGLIPQVRYVDRGCHKLR